MGFLGKMVLLSMAAVTVLGLPRPDEYNIPQVGNNRRSQYYVLHDDGSFKYGYDTGDNAFESQKTDSDGDVDGKFGYRDEDGQEFNIQYTSGTGGFVARGAHIPEVHPDVAAAFAARANARPFVDPLADAEGDRSFDFEFDGEEYSRDEVSDSDGTVSGSYSYIDEFGNTKTYRYRAGKGIGFQIEGDDIPQQVGHTDAYKAAVAEHEAIRAAQSSGSWSAHRGAASHRTSSSAHGAAGSAHRIAGSGHRAASGATTRFSTSHNVGATHNAGSRKTTGATHRATSHHNQASTRKTSSQRTVQTPTQTYFPPANSVSASSTRRNQQTFSSHFSQRAAARPQTSVSGSTRQFEAANTRTSFSPSGRYSLAYETSSHAREESGDDDNNVRGQFSFRADDDDEVRSVNYEASSATGFIASGKHLPIGPSVPGAASGQVTGRLEEVDEIEFVDPLADSDTDASFDFGFDSDSYSRTETADEDGNVVGTYSVLGEDGILRTFRYRAGEGIGFETEEISAVPSRTRASSSASSTRQQSSSSFSHGGSNNLRTPSSSFSAPSHSSSSSSFSSSSTRTSSGSAGHRGAGAHKFGGASSTRTVSTGHSGASHKFGGAASSTRTSSHSFGSHSTRSDSDEDFTLHTYDPQEGRGKYGYVLKFN